MYPGTGQRVLYAEGLRVGYRHFDSLGIEPLFPFGHGLSYTSFEYSNLRVTPNSISENGTVNITVDISNTGTRSGSEVVQLYLGFPKETSEPPQQLRAFQKVTLQPGETRSVTFMLSADAFTFWSAGLNTWAVYPGTYQVVVGASSRDIRQTGSLEITGGSFSGNIIPAESAKLTGGTTISNVYNGYTSDGYIEGFSGEQAAASFVISVEKAGKYNLTTRYTSTLRPGEQNTPRTLSLYVNASKIGQTQFPNLGNWEMWDFKTETVSLQAGDNIVTYQYDPGDSGDIHLDTILVAPYLDPVPNYNLIGIGIGIGFTLLAVIIGVVVLRWRKRTPSQ
jgi:hypothetical protein